MAETGIVLRIRGLFCQEAKLYYSKLLVFFLTLQTLSLYLNALRVQIVSPRTILILFLLQKFIEPPPPPLSSGLRRLFCREAE